MSYQTINQTAARFGLTIYGGFHPKPDDGTPLDCQTLLMLGPNKTFWSFFQSEPEARDGNPDPIDRWSTRVITVLAQNQNAEPFLPFGGPPYAPFISWATKTGRCWPSPLGMLVHDTTGLMVSFRGALALRRHIDLPATQQSPCLTCKIQPCKTTCPVDALGADGYNTDACHTHLQTPTGRTNCLARGCAARRACPISAGANRTPEQSAHHMSYFHKPDETE